MKIRKTVAYLPPEVLSEILKWLPAENLLKLRVVCKSWNSVICDPRFHQQHHLHQSRTKNIQSWEYELFNLYRYFGQTKYFDFATSALNICSRRTPETVDNIDVKEFCRGKVFILAYIDGLVLLSVTSRRVDRRENAIFLWNPVLGKVIDIPVSKTLMMFTNSNVGFGFGFDTRSNDYKLVALNLKFYDQKTKVYNLGSRSWTSPKEKRGSIDNVKYLSKTSHTFNFEGEIYWLARVGRKANNVTHYLRFNLSSEAFTCSKLPDFKYDKKRLRQESRRLLSMHESLALVDCSSYSKSEHIRVWLRRKNNTSSIDSWIELYKLNTRRKTLVNLTSNGEAYLRSWSMNGRITLYVYDLKSGEEKVGSRTNGLDLNFENGYIQSLALLGQPHSRLFPSFVSQNLPVKY
ncbi:putative F-box protein At3g25460 [Silene latifolia]|uniref:putative F-box protein At3g25460 n=1 Tax=Silene latifolia TaxID=37657 RepID=UPI003D78913D